MMNRAKQLFPVLAGLLALTGQSLPAQTPTGLTISATDKQYLMQNAQGSAAAFATAETAVQKASSSSVQQYASRLMQDHTQLTMKLLMLAHDRAITVPITLATKDRTAVNTLISLKKASFDRAFLQKEVHLDAQDVAQAKEELDTVSDPEIKDFVTQFGQTEQSHLVRAEALLRNPNAPDTQPVPTAITNTGEEPAPTSAAPVPPLTIPSAPVPLSVPSMPSPGPNVPTPAPSPTPTHGSKP